MRLKFWNAQTNMKKRFVRALWGNIWDDHDGNTERKDKVAADIRRVIESPYQMDFDVYVFGENNQRHLKEDFGIDAVVVSKDPIAYDMKTELWRHKFDILKAAMEDNDAIVYLDWDCILNSNLHVDIWERLGKKASFQGNLFLYRTKKCLWRTEDWRKVVNGGFLYIRDKDIPLKIEECYLDLRKWALMQQESRKADGKALRFREQCLIFDDEPAFCKYVDNLFGRWPGAEEYWKHFEPSVCNLRKKSAFDVEVLRQKDVCFCHML